MSDTIDNLNNEQTEPATPATPAAQTTVTQPAAQPTGKVYTDTYVHSLREEAKENRLLNATYKNALKQILGLSDSDELGDLTQRITAFNDANKKALEDANNRANSYIINSELTKLMGDEYNEKLALKLIDMSNVKVTPDGTVEGLKEALEAAVAEFPEIKKQKTPNYASGTGTSQAGTSTETDAKMEEFKRALGLK